MLFRTPHFAWYLAQSNASLRKVIMTSENYKRLAIEWRKHAHDLKKLRYSWRLKWLYPIAVIFSQFKDDGNRDLHAKFKVETTKIKLTNGCFKAVFAREKETSRQKVLILAPVHQKACENNYKGSKELDSKNRTKDWSIQRGFQPKSFNCVRP